MVCLFGLHIQYIRNDANVQYIHILSIPILYALVNAHTYLQHEHTHKNAYTNYSLYMCIIHVCTYVHMWFHVGEKAVVDLVGEILQRLSAKDTRYCVHM